MGFGASTHGVRLDDSGAVVKTYRSRARLEPDREWAALTLLARHRPGLAPEPLSCDLTADPPTVTMTRLPGVPLGGRPFPGAVIPAMATALQALFTAVPPAELDAVPAGRGLAEGVARQRQTLADLPAPVELQDLHALATDYLGSTEVARLVTDPVTPCFGRADHNLPNFLLGADGVVRLVDFEDSGRTDRAMELAALVEHLASRAVPDRQWARLLDELTLTPAELARFTQVRRVEAIFWFGLLLPGGAAVARNPPGTLAGQANRLRALF